jgi:hemoglobin
MGNHAPANSVIALAEESRESNRLSEDAIRHLVDHFYTKVRADPELGPIFERAIAGDWGPHLATMHDFWSSVILTSGRYKGNPVAVHLRVEGIEPRLFDRWLALFDETCREFFDDDDVADAFYEKASRIAESLKLALFYRPDRPWQRSTP